jgi:hypothetical protein
MVDVPAGARAEEWERACDVDCVVKAAKSTARMDAFEKKVRDSAPTPVEGVVPFHSFFEGQSTCFFES